MLFLSPSWKHDAYGITCVNKSLLNNLWIADPNGHTLELSCGVLQENNKISQRDFADATKHNVKLFGCILPRGVRQLPKLEEIDKYCPMFFQHVNIHDYTYLVGHVPYLANAVFALRDSLQDVTCIPKMILIIHALPILDGETDEELLLEWLRDAHMVLSVGHSMHDDVGAYIAQLDENQRPIHLLYLPGCSVDFLSIQRNKQDTLHGTQTILTLTGAKRDMQVKGLDFDLAVASSTKATDSLMSQAIPTQNLKLRLCTVGTTSTERYLWEEDFAQAKGKMATKYKLLGHSFYGLGESGDLTRHLKTGSLCILPFQADSSIFGIEALWAAQAGIPLLVSGNSGISNYFYRVFQDDPIIEQQGDFTQDVEAWSSRIEQKLLNPAEAHRIAGAIRQKCLLDTTIAATHLEFTKTITGTLE